MSETVQTLIKAALRAIGVIASGETPTAAELEDGRESMQFMLENWSARNIRLFYTEQLTLSASGSESYTVGTGGDINTTWPSAIRGARTADGIVKIIDEATYRQYRVNNSVGPVGYIWYNPKYPLGYLYPWPLSSDTIYIDALVPLTNPSALTTSMVFSPPYNDPVKWNLAVRMAPEYGKEVSQTVAALAISSLEAIESRNFSNQINASRLDLIRFAGRYNIDER